ncbi:MAG: glycosyltransferase [Desulfovibrionaceae bacterium]|nr:glycosyltransferase [Desulfovibrionaceae bacterium]
MTDQGQGGQAGGAAGRAPAVAVFIPVKNGSDFIEQTIRSVLSQTFQDWRLVIKDNRSTDDTPAIVARYLHDPRIVWMQHPQDLGSVGNYNSCLTDIPTKYYLILSHDDYLRDPTALEKAHAVMEAHPDVVKVHCDMLFVDGSDRPIMPRRFRRSGRMANDAVARASILTTRNLFGIPLLIRSEAVGQTRYDPELYHTADVDFSIALGRGRDMYHIPEQLIALRLHSRNNTHRRYDTISRELAASAKKNAIPLSGLDRLVMWVSDRWQRLQKYVFFKVLCR